MASLAIGKGRDNFSGFLSQRYRNMWYQGLLIIKSIHFQYTDWEHIDDGYLNQKMIGDVVGDFFFVCPCNYFAQQVTISLIKIWRKKVLPKKTTWIPSRTNFVSKKFTDSMLVDFFFVCPCNYFAQQVTLRVRQFLVWSPSGLVKVLPPKKVSDSVL